MKFLLLLFFGDQNQKNKKIFDFSKVEPINLVKEDYATVRKRKNRIETILFLSAFLLW